MARPPGYPRSPSTALWTQGALAGLLIVVFTVLGIGQFDYITDMVIFAEWAFYALCTAAVIVLRRRRPEQPRPYRAWGYPYAQVLFVARDYDGALEQITVLLDKDPKNVEALLLRGGLKSVKGDVDGLLDPPRPSASCMMMK